MRHSSQNYMASSGGSLFNQRMRLGFEFVMQSTWTHENFIRRINLRIMYVDEI
jgi:hypothetical protein